MELKQDGAAFAGSTSSPMGNGSIVDGKVSGNNMTGILKADIQGQSVDFKIEGKIDGDKMSGTFTNPGFGSIPFTASKSK